MSFMKLSKRANLLAVLSAGALVLFLAFARSDETISGYAGSGAYQLTEMLGQPVNIQVTIAFPEEGKIVGQAPCNRYFTSQDAPLPWFNVGPIGATKMACPDLDLEQQYFETLMQVSLAEIQGDQLLLSDETQVLLSFIRK